jgi:hypothetical protein
VDRQGSTEPPLHIDHVWPVSKGGGNELENLQVLCRAHNLKKAARLVQEAKRPKTIDFAALLAREWDLAADPVSLRELTRVGIARGRSDGVAEALLQRLDGEPKPHRLLPLAESLPDGTKGRPLLLARIAAYLALHDPEAAMTLAKVLLEGEEDEVRETAALALAWATPEADKARRRSFLALAATSEDSYVAAWSNLELAGLQRSPSGAAARRHLEIAARSVEPTPRALAAFELAALTKDVAEQEAWYRRALITPEPELFAEASSYLALLADDDVRARGYAAQALTSKSGAVRARGHLAIGMGEDDDALDHLKVAARSKDPVVAKLAKRYLREERHASTDQNA